MTTEQWFWFAAGVAMWFISQSIGYRRGHGAGYEAAKRDIREFNEAYKASFCGPKENAR